MVSIDTHSLREDLQTGQPAKKAGRNGLGRFASTLFGMLVVSGVLALVAVAWLIELVRTRRWPVRVFPE